MSTPSGGRPGLLRRTVTAVAVDTGALRESAPFRRLFAGQLVSLVGRQITTVAVPYQVYLLTRSPLAIGVTGIVQAIPLIGVSVGIGPVADRLDRRRILLVTQAGLAVCSALLALGAFAGRPPLAALYAVVAVAAGIGAVDSPSRTAIIPNIVRRERLPGALSLNFAMFQTTMIAGPAIGGIVIARAGLSAAYLIDVATYAASYIAVVLLPPQRPKAEHHEPMLRAMAEGLRYARRESVILGGFMMDLCAMIFGLPRAVFPILATTTYHAGAQGLGLLYAAPGAGAAVAALSTGWLRRAKRLGRVIVVAITLWGIAIIGFGFARTLWLALLLLVIAGAADSLSAVCRSTIMQTLVPDRLRGRLSALYFMVVSGGPYLGDLEAGGIANAFGVQVSIVSGGVLCLVGLGAVTALVPAVWHYRQQHAVPVDAAPAAVDAAQPV